MNLGQARKNLFRRISHWGVTPDLHATFAKRIILTNLLGLLFTINMSLSAVAFLFIKQYGLALFTAFFVLTEFSWPCLNLFKKYNVSRLGLLVSSNFLGLIVSIFLPGTGYNHGFFVMAGIPILLFDLKEKSYILIGLILPAVMYPLSEWAQYQLPTHGFGIELAPWTIDVIHYSTGSIYVVLIFIMFLFLSRENARAEEQLETERARAFSSAKFAALGEMASGIGHEINNPLTVIDLNTEQLKYMLKSSDFDTELAIQRADVISKTAHRISRIVEALRSFSREAGDDSFREEPVKKIVEDTLTFCSERFKHHKVKLDICFESENFVIRCRAVQISQVLLNLLNNAFDSVEELPEKWIRLNVSQNKTKGEILIRVTDSGNGIAPEEQEKIFLPFYTTKPVGKGTGLGLSLSKKITEDHGASLVLDSDSPHTSFVLTFSTK